MWAGSHFSASVSAERFVPPDEPGAELAAIVPFHARRQTRAMQAEAFLMIALPVLMGLFAVGAMLFIKLKRRSQTPSTDPIATAVPIMPMSPAQAAAIRRRYFWAVCAILLGLLAYAVWLGES